MPLAILKVLFTITPQIYRILLGNQGIATVVERELGI